MAECRSRPLFTCQPTSTSALQWRPSGSSVSSRVAEHLYFCRMQKILGTSETRVLFVNSSRPAAVAFTQWRKARRCWCQALVPLAFHSRPLDPKYIYTYTWTVRGQSIMQWLSLLYNFQSQCFLRLCACVDIGACAYDRVLMYVCARFSDLSDKSCATFYCGCVCVGSGYVCVCFIMSFLLTRVSFYGHAADLYVYVRVL